MLEEFLNDRKKRLLAIIILGIIYYSILGFGLSVFLKVNHQIYFPKFSWYPPSFILNLLSINTDPDWVNNFWINFGINYHNRVGQYLDNSILNFVKNNIKIFLTLSLIFGFLFTLSIVTFPLVISMKVKDKTLTGINIFLGLISFLVIFVYTITRFNTGAWEIGLFSFWYWKWPLFIIAGLILFVVIKIQEDRVKEPGFINTSRFLSLPYFLFIILFFVLQIYYSNSETNIEVEVRSDRSWQTSGISVAKGQKISVNCEGSTWTIDKNNLEEFPFTATYGSIIFIKKLSIVKDDMPVLYSSPGALIAKVGLDDHTYNIGNYLVFTSKNNGFIYFRINDPDYLLWNNEGVANCKLIITRPKLLESLSIDGFKNLINQQLTFIRNIYAQ